MQTSKRTENMIIATKSLIVSVEQEIYSLSHVIWSDSGAKSIFSVRSLNYVSKAKIFHFKLPNISE